MYFYYFLMAVKCKPKWFNPKWITIAQITQMVVGSMVSIISFNALRKPGCWAQFENNVSILIMYVSYFLLFVQFFFKRYGFGVTGTVVDKNSFPKAKKLV
jgi:elongation of very long chain fatty acids protein 6